MNEKELKVVGNWRGLNALDIIDGINRRFDEVMKKFFAQKDLRIALMEKERIQRLSNIRSKKNRQLLSTQDK